VIDPIPDSISPIVIGELHDAAQTQSAQCRIVERGGPRHIRDTDTCVIDHADAPVILMPVEYRTRKLKAHHQPGREPIRAPWREAPAATSPFRATEDSPGSSVNSFYQLFPIAGGGHLSMVTISRTPPRAQKKKATQEPISSHSQPSAIRASRAAVSTARKSTSGSSGVLSTTWLQRSRTTSHVASRRGFKGSGRLRLLML